MRSDPICPSVAGLLEAVLGSLRHECLSASGAGFCTRAEWSAWGYAAVHCVMLCTKWWCRYAGYDVNTVSLVKSVAGYSLWSSLWCPALPVMPVSGFGLVSLCVQDFMWTSLSGLTRVPVVRRQLCREAGQVAGHMDPSHAGSAYVAQPAPGSQRVRVRPPCAAHDGLRQPCAAAEHHPEPRLWPAQAWVLP